MSVDLFLCKLLICVMHIPMITELSSFKHILSENTVRFAIFAFDVGAVLGWIVVALPRSQGLVIWDLRVKTGTDIGNECTQKMHDRSLRMP